MLSGLKVGRLQVRVCVLANPARIESIPIEELEESTLVESQEVKGKEDKEILFTNDMAPQEPFTLGYAQRDTTGRLGALLEAGVAASSSGIADLHIVPLWDPEPGSAMLEDDDDIGHMEQFESWMKELLSQRNQIWRNFAAIGRYAQDQEDRNEKYRMSLTDTVSKIQSLAQVLESCVNAQEATNAKWYAGASEQEAMVRQIAELQMTQRQLEHQVGQGEKVMEVLHTSITTLSDKALPNKPYTHSHEVKHVGGAIDCWTHTERSIYSALHTTNGDGRASDRLRRQGSSS